MNNGVAYINFSEEILKIKSNGDSLSSVFQSVALTVKEHIEDIDAIKIPGNGKSISKEFIGHDEPIAVPSFANKY